MGAISKALEEHPLECVFIKLVKTFDKEDNEAINRAINNGSSGYVISSAIRAGGASIAASTVTLHLRSLCRCPR